jgi:opacity protein-like surface antigen
MRKILLAAAALAALAAPATAHAVDVPVDVQIVPIGNGQYAWTCAGHANPVAVTSFNLWCNGQSAVGVHPVKAIGGVSSTPTVCYRVVFWFKGGVASRDDCVSL